MLFKREGIAIGYDRFLRIYRANALQVRPRRKRKVNYVRGNVVPAVSRPNERWSIDFMHDRLANGRKIRTLNIVDDFTRECLALRIAYSFGSADVIREFEDIAFERGFPETIRFDNGPEFTSLALLRWSAERPVHLHFIEPGKPTQNAMTGVAETGPPGPHFRQQEHPLANGGSPLGKRHSPEAISVALRQLESGMAAAEIAVRVNADGIDGAYHSAENQQQRRDQRSHTAP